MALHVILRTMLLTFLPVAVCGAAFGAEDGGVPAKSVNYKRADTNFYAKGDILKSDPTAVILPPTAFAQNGDTYAYTPKKKAPKTLYIEAPSDWIEPITPPDMPASLNIPSDAMQIREPQGDVQVAMPNAPANFSPVSDGMNLPNGAVVKTGPNATAAILFGGVDSARLMPGSEAAVQQAVTATSRSAEVDLTAGGVFAKVGTQVGVTGQFQVHTPSGNALAQGGDFAVVSLSGRTDVWVSSGVVELLQPDGKKFGTATGNGTGPLKLIRYPAIADPAQSQQADAESLTAIMNFIPVANQKLAGLHAKEAKGTPLTANEQAYLQRIKQVPALIKLALVETPPTEIQVLADGTVSFAGTTIGLAELSRRLTDLIDNTYEPSVNISAEPGATYANYTAVLKAVKDAKVPHFATVGPVPAKPAPAPPPPKPPPAAPAVPPAPAAPAVAAKPAAPPEPVTITIHANATIKFQNATMGLEEFQTKIKAFAAAHPDQAVIVHVSPKTDYAKYTAIIDACKNAPIKELAVEPPTPQPPPAAPATPVAAPTTPAAPAVTATPAVSVPPPAPRPPKPVEPATVLVHEDGSIGFLGKRGTLDDFKKKLATVMQATPQREIIIKPSSAKLPYDHIKAVLDACSDAHVAHVSAAPPPPAQPLPVTAETPPAAPAQPVTAETPPAPKPTPPPPMPVNNAPVPAELTLADDGSLTLDGAPITEDELKTKLADLKKTNPKNPLVLTKQSKVTKDQWKHYVDLCHAMGLKLLVKNAKPLPAPIATTPPAPRPAAAEGGSTAPPTPAPHLSASPAPNETPAEAPPASPAAEEAVPVEIELTPDGQVSFLGEAVSDAELKSRLDGVAKSNPTEPLVIVKDEKVTHDQLQRVVDACHEAKLKVKVKTVKSADSGALKPRAHGAVALSTLPPPSGVSPAPAAPSGAPKLLPVEIALGTKGRLTFEGENVNLDDLESRLATVAKTNPNQPVIIMRDADVPDDSVDALVTLCHAARLHVTVKTAPSFPEPAPPDATAASTPSP